MIQTPLKTRVLALLLNRFSTLLYTVFGLLVFPALMIAQEAPIAIGPMAPEVIYFGGKIATVNEFFDIVEAVAVREGRVLAVGTNEQLLALAAESTALVDLDGKTVLPGFYDNHNHLGAGSADDRQNDWSEVTSKEVLLAEVRRVAGEIPAGAWILGGLQNENMPQERLPNRWELDAAAPNHPVWIRRGHISIANSLAMRLANVTRDTPQPEGGSIDLNSEGEPIGWFREGAGHRMISRAVPPAPLLPDSIAYENMRRSLRGLLAYGITSTNVPGVIPQELRWVQGTYDHFAEELPRATVQVRIRPGYDDYDDPSEGVRISLEEIEGIRFFTGYGNDRIKLGAIKMSIDGGFSAAAFWTVPPHAGTEDYHGVIRITPEILYPVAKRAHDLGWQLGIHAIGDGAVEMVVDTYARILAENPREDHRHYLHHFSVKPSAATLQTMVENEIYVASQPNFTYSLGPYNASPALTPERLATNNPQQSLRTLGIPVSFGSDGMPTGPLVGIYAAVTRRGVDGKVYGPEEAISIEEAIRSYTIGSATLTFDEENRGSLEIGKYADMVVLSEDILTIDPLRIMEIEIEQTIVGGEVLYDAPNDS